MSTDTPGVTLILWNVVSLNIGWWSSVLSAAQGAVWIGPAVIAVLVTVHLTLTPARARDVVTMIAVGVFGYGVDSLLVLSGAFGIPASAHVGWPSPIWMVALWVNLATAFNIALYWLVKKPVLGAMLGAVGGPLAYMGGWHFGALAAPAGVWTLAGAVAVEWAIATPIVLTGAVHIARWMGRPVPAEADGTHS